MSHRAIEAYAKEIGIPYLLHFTRATNLPSILSHGLYPIGRANEIGASPAINDRNRLDGYRDSTSVSIGFPNCQMLYKYRMGDDDVDWAILILSVQILWLKKCAFCRHNAADGRISTQPLTTLKAPQSFIGMYEEIEGIPSRAEQKLKPFDPTDVQAEVLVFDIIERQHIFGVVFEKAAIRDVYMPFLGTVRTYIHANNKGMFANRKYARTWGK